jgi:cellobiose-specific phosphotransferase system component IIC
MDTSSKRNGFQKKDSMSTILFYLFEPAWDISRSISGSCICFFSWYLFWFFWIFFGWFVYIDISLYEGFWCWYWLY